LLQALLDALIDSFLRLHLYVEGKRGDVEYTLILGAGGSLTEVVPQVSKEIVLAGHFSVALYVVSHLQEEIVKTA
jgi:hypothetical protein